MSIYTYVGNRDSSDKTGAVSLRNGGLKMAINQYADLTDPEYASLSSRFILQAGVVGSATQATGAAAAPVSVSDVVLAGTWQKTGSGALSTPSDQTLAQTLTTAGGGTVERLDYILSIAADVRRKVIRIPMQLSTLTGWTQVWVQLSSNTGFTADKLFNVGASTKTFRVGLIHIVAICPELLFNHSGSTDLSSIAAIGCSVNDGGASKVVSLGKPRLLG